MTQNNGKHFSTFHFSHTHTCTGRGRQREGRTRGRHCIVFANFLFIILMLTERHSATHTHTPTQIQTRKHTNNLRRRTQHEVLRFLWHVLYIFRLYLGAICRLRVWTATLCGAWQTSFEANRVECARCSMTDKTHTHTHKLKKSCQPRFN